MRSLIQIVCVVLIAVGAGLSSFGKRLDPSISFLEPTKIPINFGNHISTDTRYEASAACGVGMAFLVFGTLGLLMPMINKLSTARFAELNDTAARLLSMVAIWLSIALILAFGVLRLNWSGTAAMLIMLVLVALICGSATACTAIVFGWKPWARETKTIAPSDVAASDKDMA